MAEKKILLFGFSDSRGRNEALNLRQKLQGKRIAVEVIERKMYLKPIGELAGIFAAGTGKNAFAGIPFGDYKGPELSARLLVFAEIGADELDRLLAVCAECGMTKDDLKAVLTPVNASWNAVGLCNELMKEHRQMK